MRTSPREVPAVDGVQGDATARSAVRRYSAVGVFTYRSRSGGHRTGGPRTGSRQWLKPAGLSSTWWVTSTMAWRVRRRPDRPAARPVALTPTQIPARRRARYRAQQQFRTSVIKGDRAVSTALRSPSTAIAASGRSAQVLAAHALQRVHRPGVVDVLVRSPRQRRHRVPGRDQSQVAHHPRRPRSAATARRAKVSAPPRWRSSSDMSTRPSRSHRARHGPPCARDGCSIAAAMHAATVLAAPFRPGSTTQRSSRFHLPGHRADYSVRPRRGAARPFREVDQQVGIGVFTGVRPVDWHLPS